MSVFKDFAQFCADHYACRWDKAGINLAISFMGFFLLVIGLKSIGVLYLSEDRIYDLATAGLATVCALGIGILAKRQ